MEEKITNAFNKHPIVFDDACGLLPTIQRVYVRLYSWLWGNNENEWKGSYPKLAQLTKLSVGSVHEARRKLVEAGLISVSILPNKGNTDTLSIKITPDRLWSLNKRYCALSLNERDMFAQQYSWETLDQLAQCLSDFEKQRSSLSENERRLSNNENRQAQRLSKSEKHLSNNERQRVSESASNAGSRVPTDEDTDITDTKTDDSISISPEVQIFLAFWKAYRFRKSAATINAKNIAQYEKLAPKIQTQEDFESICALAMSRLPSVNDGKLWLANLISCLDDWEMNKEQSQPTPEQQKGDYIKGLGMPGDTEKMAYRAINAATFLRVDKDKEVRRRLNVVYERVQSRSGFKRLVREICQQEANWTLEGLMKRLEEVGTVEVIS